MQSHIYILPYVGARCPRFGLAIKVMCIIALLHIITMSTYCIDIHYHHKFCHFVILYNMGTSIIKLEEKDYMFSKTYVNKVL